MAGDESGAHKTISEAEYELWLPPPLALKRLSALLSEGPAMEEIYRRLCEGQVRSVARTANWYDQQGFSTDRHFELLHDFLWQTDKPRDYDNFWKTGSHTLSRRLFASSNKQYPIKCFGIRFDPEGINGILKDGGVGMPDATAAAPAKNTGGRPRKAYWEDALAAIFERLWNNEFKPTNQADIETEMAQWILDNHRDSPSEASIRTRAAKLWKICKK